MSITIPAYHHVDREALAAIAQDYRDFKRRDLFSDVQLLDLAIHNFYEESSESLARAAAAILAYRNRRIEDQKATEAAEVHEEVPAAAPNGKIQVMASKLLEAVGLQRKQ